MRTSLKDRMSNVLSHRHIPEELRKKKMRGVKKITSVLYNELMEIKRQREKWLESHRPLFLAIGLCISLLFVNAAFIWKTEKTIAVLEYSDMNSGTNELIEVPISKQPPPPPPKKMVDLFVIKEVEDEVIEEMEINLDVEISEESEIEEIIYEEPVEEDVDEVFTIVETRPMPKGGMKAFNQYLADNLRYPNSAMRMGITGRVFLRFIVEKDGSITNIEVVKGIGGGCDKEAVRVLDEAPAWSPGKQRGQPVRVNLILPISFILAD